MREIVLDTETTGLSPKAGHRVVEIGCIELKQHMPTGEVFHVYLNPERAMPDEAFRIHGLSDAFLSDKRLFADVAPEFLSFIGDAKLIIHNAAFDLSFLNAELERIDETAIPMTQAVDTVALARRKFPGAHVSLDDLCRRFEVDLSGREKHGALLDSELLAVVYLELIGGRQPGFELAADGSGTAAQEADGMGRSSALPPKNVREPRPHQPDVDEIAAHEAFLEKLTDPLWRG